MIFWKTNMCDNIIARLLIICKIQINNVNNCRFKCNVVIVPYAAAENCMISPKPPCIKGEADASRTQGDCPRNYSFYIAGSKRTERRLSLSFRGGEAAVGIRSYFLHLIRCFAPPSLQGEGCVLASPWGARCAGGSQIAPTEPAGETAVSVSWLMRRRKLRIARKKVQGAGDSSTSPQKRLRSEWQA